MPRRPWPARTLGALALAAAVTGGTASAQLHAGRLTESHAILSSVTMRHWTVADFDGDHRPEAVAVRPVTSAAVEVWVAQLDPDVAAWSSAAITVDLDSTGQPLDVAAADLTADGLPDLVVLRPGLIAVCPSDGQGGFLPAVVSDIPSPSDALQLMRTDIASDGSVEFLELSRSAGSNPDYAQVWTDAGGGALTPVQKVPLATTSFFVKGSVGDLDQDGLQDLAVGDLNTETMSVLRGRPDDTLGPPEVLFSMAPGIDLGGFCAVDHDGDGDLDLVVAGGSGFGTHSRLYPFENDGSGSFQPLPTVSAAFGNGSSASEMLPADFDADGTQDLIVTHASDGGLFFGGKGNGLFVLEGALCLGNALSPGLEDVNCDGWDDVLVSTTNSLWVVFGRSTGATVPGAFPLGGESFTGWTSRLADGDLDGDGVVDVVAAKRSELHVLAGSVDGSFDLTASATGPESPHQLLLRDLDGDGGPDLLLAASGSAHELQVGTSLDLGGVGPVTIHSLPASPTSLDVGDLDSDGDLDALTAGVTLLINDGLMLGPAHTYGATGPCRLGDLDGDGDLDALTSTWELYRGDGLGAFLPAEPVGGSLPPVSDVLLADLDLDGALDAIGDAYVVHGDGTGQLELVQVLDVAMQDGALEDLDADGHDDLVIPSEEGLLVAMGLAGGLFAPTVATAGQTDSQVLLTDVDADGHADLLSISSPDDANLCVTPNRAAWSRPFDLLDGGAPGVTGTPVLSGHGTLESGSVLSITLSKAQPGSTSHLVWGLSPLDAPFKGGTLVPFPDAILVEIPLSGSGSTTGEFPIPAGVPGGLELYLQMWVEDGTTGSGLAGSNGLRITTP